MEEKIKRFQELAARNYDLPGWDIFTETYDDDDIVEFLEDVANVDEVEKAMESLADIWDDRMQDAKNSAF